MEFLQQNLMWVALALVSGGMLLWPILTGAGTESLTPAQATLLINRQDAIVLDVREGKEWEAGHIAGARHVVLSQLDNRLPELEKHKQRPIIVCCASGARSATACTKLKRAGFEKVYNLAGGLPAWSEANLPTTTKT